MVVVVLWGSSDPGVGSRNCGRTALGRIPALLLPLSVTSGRFPTSHRLPSLSSPESDCSSRTSCLLRGSTWNSACFVEYLRRVSCCHFYCCFHNLGALLNLINFTNSKKQKLCTKMFHANAVLLAETWRPPDAPTGGDAVTV